MRKGTTPKHTFTLPFAIPDGSLIRVAYSQDDELLFVKTGEQCEVNADMVSTRLTQEDTLTFDCTKLAQIQLRVLTPEGEALTSDVITVTVEECLDACVMCFEEDM